MNSISLHSATVYRLVLLFLYCLRCPSSLASATECENGLPAIKYKRSYVVHRLQTLEEIKIDGYLDEDAWKQVPWTEDFQDIENIEDGAKIMPDPRFRTRAKIRWDNQYLYVGAELQEQYIWANVTKHNDVIFNDNDFEIFVDPGSSTHGYKEFEINARNVFWSLNLPKPYLNGGKPECNNPSLCQCCWDIKDKVRSAVALFPSNGHINNAEIPFQKWTVEVALPIAEYLEKLPEAVKTRSIPKEGARWRLNFSRVEYRVRILPNNRTIVKDDTPADNWVWQPTGAVDIHLPERWGTIVFTSQPPYMVPQHVQRRLGLRGIDSRDPEWPMRAVLSKVYEAQMAYRVLYGDGFARTIERLVISAQLNQRIADGKCQTSKPDMTVSSSRDRFQVRVIGTLPNGVCYQGSINEDRFMLVQEC